MVCGNGVPLVTVPPPRHVLVTESWPANWRVRPPDKVKPKRLFTGTTQEKSKHG